MVTTEKFMGIWNKQTGMPMQQKMIAAPKPLLLLAANCQTEPVRKVNLGGNIVETAAPMRERDPHDFYPTPVKVCEAALNLLTDSNPKAILDPGAGTGVWGQAARKRWCRSFIDGIELRRDAEQPTNYDSWQHGDFLTQFNPMYFDYDLVIGNPPYGVDAQGNKDKLIAEKFIRKSLSLVRDGGNVVFLLRLAMLEGQERGAGLWRELPPKSVHVLSARPSFITEGDKAGKTDATAYAIFIWEKGWQGVSSLGWLDWKTPRAAGVPAPAALPMFAEAR